MKLFTLPIRKPVEKNVEKSNKQRETIVFLNYLIWTPDSEECSGKYRVFSQEYKGIMFHLSHLKSDKKKQFHEKFTSYSSWWWDLFILRFCNYLIVVISKSYSLSRVSYIICYDPLLCGVTGYLLKLIRGGKLVVEVNGNHFYGYNSSHGFWYRIRWSLRRMIVGFVLRHVDGVKFLNRKMMDQYLAMFDVNGKVYVGGGDYVATDYFNVCSVHDNYILLVGGPFHIKGVDILIKAFNIVSPLHPSLRLIIIGHDTNVAYYKGLTESNDKIQFLGGMPQRLIRKYFERCRIFILPSRTEALGRVLIEAMACGKPVIGSNVEGIGELINDGVNGLLFESENDQDLAEKILLTLSDDQLVEKISRNAIGTAQLFSPPHYYKNYKKFLDSLP